MSWRAPTWRRLNVEYPGTRSIEPLVVYQPDGLGFGGDRGASERVDLDHHMASACLGSHVERPTGRAAGHVSVGWDHRHSADSSHPKTNDNQPPQKGDSHGTGV
jgi:hypothetical protein